MSTQEWRAGDAIASLFYAINLLETQNWLFCASHPHPHGLCILLWVLQMEICKWPLSLPRKLLSHPATLSGSHYSLTPPISLAFVHLQGRPSVRVTERMGFDSSETGLESESCDPEPLSSEGPKLQARQGLRQLSCCTVAHIIMGRLNCTSTQAQGIASAQVWMQFSITSHLFACRNTVFCPSIVFWAPQGHHAPSQQADLAEAQGWWMASRNMADYSRSRQLILIKPL